MTPQALAGSSDHGSASRGTAAALPSPCRHPIEWRPAFASPPSEGPGGTTRADRPGGSRPSSFPPATDCSFLAEGPEEVQMPQATQTLPPPSCPLLALLAQVPEPWKRQEREQLHDAPL
jgi:hypothetical protein